MDFSPQWLEGRLKAWPAPRRYVVLASGGMDSTALLHAMATIAHRLPASVVALHFNHGLRSQADIWQRQVADQAQSLGILFHNENLGLAADQGSTETRARAARYARLRTWMAEGDCCLTAHHGDDQAETFLLQALRGSGPAGLAAMPGYMRFERGWLARPLLPWTRADLHNWASKEGLNWSEDPGNYNLDSPRNRLRHRVWPQIEQGWPAAARTLGRSAALAAEASALAQEVAVETYNRLPEHPADRLPVAALQALSVPKRRAVLRYWLGRNGVDLPAAEKLQELEHGFVLRDPGARARLQLGLVGIRRFRDFVFVVRSLPRQPFGRAPIDICNPVDMGALGRIGLVADQNGPMGQNVVDGALELRFRRGGETFRPAGCAHQRPLKKMLQECGVLPWMRYRLPLLYVDGQLAAVANMMVAQEYAGQGWRLDWQDAPALE
ncbi:MAG: tRNA lysidine(34) synthetase TilS [Gammaproteobacteria bacterium]|nr:tRNA lysidine(34) synthetase TilS [Gammaproteobacteria bacterium]